MNRLAILTAVLVGCAVEESASGPQLLIPDVVTVDWDSSLNEIDDGLIALVPVDVMVYDSQSGEPMGGVELELLGTAPDTLLLSSDEIQSIALSDDRDDASQEGVAWDVWRDRYVQLDSVELFDRLLVSTDATGLARIYVVVDRFSVGDDGMAVSATVTVSTDDIEHELVLRPR